MTTTRTRRRLARSGVWLLSAIILVAAWFVVADTPTLADKREPFEVSVPAPEWGTGRNLTARVVGATFADEVDDGSWAAPGNWFVVQIETAAIDGPASLEVTELSVDGVVYSATDRTDITMSGESLLVGVPLTGVLAFDLPAGVATGTAELHLGASPDRRLDSIIVVPLDLDEMTRVPRVTLFASQFPTT